MIHAQTPTPRTDAYESWRLATDAPAATPAGRIQCPEGFHVELLRSALPEEDSWISLAFDPKGRLTIAREQQGLLRLTLDGTSVSGVEIINEDLQECRGLLYLGDTLYANANNSRGFYRLRDTDGDDQLDETTLLFETSGGVGHGRNHIRLGPDGRIYLVHGDSVELPATYSPLSPFRNYAVDQFAPTALGTAEDKRFRNEHREPYGYVLAWDPDGTGDLADDLTLFAGGLRNQLDVDFNRDGEAFIYDADMEWDAGLPWYRPTRVLHIVSGGEYGWRSSPGTFPVYSEDSLPSTCDIGLGSPTGVGFGYDSNFPTQFSEAFFIADWAYGRILAVTLSESGATYTGAFETFLSGRPLNVTDFVFGPDGAMYFVTGGRKTQSGLYRVSYEKTHDKVGRSRVYEGGIYRERDKLVPSEPSLENPSPLSPGKDDPTQLRQLRRDLEVLHVPGAPNAIDLAWPHLDHPDRSIRFAARVAVENQPLEHWQRRALDSGSLTAWLALARVGPPSEQTNLLKKLGTLDLAAMTGGQRLLALRTCQVALIRMGEPGPATKQQCAGHLLASYPGADSRANRELAELLAHLAPVAEVLERTLALLDRAETSEDLIHYLYLFQYFPEETGWTLDQRRRAFEALAKAEARPGGRTYHDALTLIRATLVDPLGAEERLALARFVHPPMPPARDLPQAPDPATIVHHWTMEELLPELAAFDPAQRNPASGKDAYLQANCALCHRLGDVFNTGASPAPPGGVLGPDLAGVANRFALADILAAIIHPSDVIAEIYRIPEAPNISAMPPGLLDVLTRDQILDLLAFLETASAP